GDHPVDEAYTHAEALVREGEEKSLEAQEEACRLARVDLGRALPCTPAARFAPRRLSGRALGTLGRHGIRRVVLETEVVALGGDAGLRLELSLETFGHGHVWIGPRDRDLIFQRV